jgi:hypothetical protein
VTISRWQWEKSERLDSALEVYCMGYMSMEASNCLI